MDPVPYRYVPLRHLVELSIGWWLAGHAAHAACPSSVHVGYVLHLNLELLSRFLLFFWMFQTALSSLTTWRLLAFRILSNVIVTSWNNAIVTFLDSFLLVLRVSESLNEVHFWRLLTFWILLVVAWNSYRLHVRVYTTCCGSWKPERN